MKTKNPGIASLSEEIRLGRYDDPEAIVAFAREAGVAFAVVGPEDPMSLGVVDALAASGIPADSIPETATPALSRSRSRCPHSLPAVPSVSGSS
jgi:phosphoribosylamine--glycine ligase